MFVVLALAFLVCLVIAWIMGRLTASKVIAPVTDLAKAVGAGLQDLPSMQSTDEMGVLARAFAARTKDLQDVLTRERWFTADVSHELRTPLTVMLGASEVLAADDTLQPWSAAAVERIRRVASDASERVSAMLLLARAPETMGAPRVALRPIVQQELEEHRHLLEGKPVQLVLEAEGEVHVFARHELVAIAIGNLVRNACQFTEAGTVLVRLESERIIVEDTGPGLPPRITQHLFERFVHADDNAMSGSGLGLAIVHRVIEHLGWSIALEGKSGGGTRFVICFKPV
jgi:signal transduction histidine kinase